MHRIEIRDMNSRHIPHPHIMDVLLDGREMYFEVKLQKIRERVSISEILRQMDASIGDRSNRPRLKHLLQFIKDTFCHPKTE